MDQALGPHSRTHARRLKEISNPPFDDASAYALFDVLLGAPFDDNRVDSFEVQEMSKEQPCRTCSDNHNLCSLCAQHSSRRDVEFVDDSEATRHSSERRLVWTKNDTSPCDAVIGSDVIDE
jgi:hypothetical protein